MEGGGARQVRGWRKGEGGWSRPSPQAPPSGEGWVMGRARVPCRSLTWVPWPGRPPCRTPRPPSYGGPLRLRGRDGGGRGGRHRPAAGGPRLTPPVSRWTRRPQVRVAGMPTTFRPSPSAPLRGRPRRRHCGVAPVAAHPASVHHPPPFAWSPRSWRHAAGAVPPRPHRKRGEVLGDLSRWARLWASVQLLPQTPRGG